MIRNLVSRFLGSGGATRGHAGTRTTATGTASGGIGARVGSAVERMIRRR